MKTAKTRDVDRYVISAQQSDPTLLFRDKDRLTQIEKANVERRAAAERDDLYTVPRVDKVLDEEATNWLLELWEQSNRTLLGVYKTCAWMNPELPGPEGRTDEHSKPPDGLKASK